MFGCAPGAPPSTESSTCHVKCSRSLDSCPRCKTLTLWRRFHNDPYGEAVQDRAGDLVACAEEEVADYRDLIRS